MSRTMEAKQLWVMAAYVSALGASGASDLPTSLAEIARAQDQDPEVKEMQT